MHAFTLRLEPSLDKKLASLCREKGLTKTGLVKKLIKEFVDENTKPRDGILLSPEKQHKALRKLCGIISLGGNAVEDCEDYWS